MLSATGSPPPHKQPPHIPPPCTQLCLCTDHHLASVLCCATAPSPTDPTCEHYRRSPQTTLRQRSRLHAPQQRGKAARVEGCFSLSKQAALPFVPPVYLYNRSLPSLPPISHRSHLVFPAAERWKHSSGRTEPVCLSEGLGAKFSVLPSQKNSSKAWVHTWCINMYICAYIHTYTHDAAIQNLQHSFVSRLALCEYDALTTGRGKNPVQ